ncbi:MAG: heavy metal translocating P-type ATPase metal-binding domain-containing protein, partial [Bacteroidetes bacterium]|nr:heavy metal translocating P-type ATPase metal-binding domain-containing protein [Bacteroidota bacterium]
MGATVTAAGTTCYHCGEVCRETKIIEGEKFFCCEGCKMVYGLLQRNGLCTYYDLNQAPGQNLRQPLRSDKFAFLDDRSIAARLVSFSGERETHVCFYLPQLHCSSCLYLLENLHRLEPAVISCRVDFPLKEATIVFDHAKLSLRSLAELLASIGYEPYISLDNTQAKPAKAGSSLV